MSLTSFEHIVTIHPELTQVAERVNDWLRTHERKQYIEALTLARDLTGQVRPLDVVRFLSALEESGDAKVEYRVLSPANTIVDESFESPDEVPPEIVDNLGRPFPVEYDRIIPVYRVRRCLSTKS